MLSGLLGRKVGMTQVFGENGTAIPVTVIEAGPCIITQIKTTARDGYEAVQIGFEQARLKSATRPELGHLGHSLPLLKAQRKRLQTYQQQQRGKKVTGEEAEKKEQTETASAESKKDKQIEKLLKVQQNRQRRPGPELGPFRVLREVAHEAPGAAVCGGVEAVGVADAGDAEPDRVPVDDDRVAVVRDAAFVTFSA